MRLRGPLRDWTGIGAFIAALVIVALIVALFALASASIDGG